MRKMLTLASIAALTFAAVPAFAESSEPFMFSAPGLVQSGSAFFTDTGSSGYPVTTGRHVQAPDSGKVRAQNGAEAPLHSLQEVGLGHPRG